MGCSHSCGFTRRDGAGAVRGRTGILETLLYFSPPPNNVASLAELCAACAVEARRCGKMRRVFCSGPHCAVSYFHWFRRNLLDHAAARLLMQLHSFAVTRYTLYAPTYKIGRDCLTIRTCHAVAPQSEGGASNRVGKRGMVSIVGEASAAGVHAALEWNKDEMGR